MSAGRRIGAGLALLLALGAAPILAQPSPGAVQDAQRAARAEQAASEAAAQAARAAAAEEHRLAERRVEAARRLQAAEQRLSDAGDQLRAAEAAAAAAGAALRERMAALSPAIPVMLRLALWPAESLLAVPAPPEEALRGLLVLQGLSRGLAAEAVAFRRLAGEAERRATESTTRAAEFGRAEAAARTAAAALEVELQAARENRAEAEDAATEAARRAAASAARAKDLGGALARLQREEARREAEAARAEAARARAEARAAAERPSPEARPEPRTAAARQAEPPEPMARGGRAVPVAGRVVREYGAVGEGGPARGLTFQAPAGARVVSPCGGRVVFGAPFRSYGLLLIVDCGDGYHFVLGGLDRLDASPGQRVLAGEPVGQLGDGAEPSGKASLYVELRRRGKPIDPRGWLAARG
ncbi:peptidoglycan DD-metalloendopeptidase family protein [Siccirubricoccus sp. G192]|uniref:murein hydrolase activator EnvC family protein n=1 Tax=Siccirubricoccus sp. G192 TaxID=2849651 RepID=UPI001C2BE2E6|nr:peptidoglycan DD-metalloendopeptidase family protein [Siccirubricoccus sp. G192]MBV1797024.1 peptidoglycan DD-metalloendopeptidase family protein [Siccirubricoccus sp. G192]